MIEKIASVGNRVAGPRPERGTVVEFGYDRSTAMLAAMDRLPDRFRERYPRIQVQPMELPQTGYSRTLKEYMETGMVGAAMLNNNNFQDFAEESATDLLDPLEQDDSCILLLRPVCTERTRLH